MCGSPLAKTIKRILSTGHKKKSCETFRRISTQFHLTDHITPSTFYCMDRLNASFLNMFQSDCVVNRKIENSKSIRSFLPRLVDDCKGFTKYK